MPRITLITPDESKPGHVYKTARRLRDGSYDLTPNAFSHCRVKYRHYADFSEFAAILDEESQVRLYCPVRMVLTDPTKENSLVPRRGARSKNSAMIDAEFDWVCLDIDGMAMPAHLDPVADPEGVVDYAISRLPEYFHRVSCWWQFSASQNLPGFTEVIKLHLFYLMSKPVSNPLLKKWVESQDVALRLDPAVAGGNQPIYIAAPDFLGDNDPLPRRTGTYLSDFERLPMELKSSDKKLLPKGKGNIMPIGLRETLARRLTGMGDHEGGERFHEPLKKAVGAAFGAFPMNLDREELKRLLREFIEAAPKDARLRQDGSIERYLSDAFLDELIANIAAREEEERQKIRSALDDMLADYVYVAGLGRFFRVRTGQLLLKNQVNDMHLHEGKTLADKMLVTPEMRKVDSVTYFPNQPLLCMDTDPETEHKLHCLNTWRPYDPPRRESSDVAAARITAPIFDHVKLLVDGDEDVYRYMTQWLAWNVQHPGEKINYALLIQGGQGTGKSLLADVMKAALGAANVRMISNDELVSTFTGWMQGRSLITVEEIYDPQGRLALYNRLKSIITQTSMTVNEKNMPAYASHNRFNVMAFTNHEDALFMENDDRRFLIHHSQMKPKEAHYYKALYYVIENFPAELRLALMNVSLAGFDPKGHAPATESKTYVQEHLGNPVERYIRDGLESGQWPFGGDVVNVEELCAAMKKVDWVARPSIVYMVMKKMGGGPLGAGKRLNDNRKARLWAARDIGRYASMGEKDVAGAYRKPLFDFVMKTHTYEGADGEVYDEYNHAVGRPKGKF
jgi:hypothetical protein